MADRQLSVVIDGKNNLNKPLADAGKAVSSFSKNASSALTSVIKTTAKLTAAVAGVGAAISGISMKQAVEFDRSMRNVDSIAKLTEGSFSSLRDEVLELSKTLPQSADDLARGLYDVYSSGFDGELAMQILEQSAKGASAGLSTTATSAQALMTVMNAYNRKTGADAASIMDVLFQTVNRGVVTFDQLSSEIGTVAASAAVANVPIEQIGAGFAVLTKHGINAAETSTALNRMLLNIINPSTEAAETAKSLGLEWNIGALKAKGFIGVMEDMVKATKGDEKLMSELAGDARAVKAAFILSAQGGREFREELSYMMNAAGATQGALERQSKGTAFQMQILKNNLSAIGIAISTAALPHVNRFIQKLIDLAHLYGPRVIEFMTSWRERFNGVIERVTAFVDSHLPALIRRAEELRAVISGVAQAIADFAGPILNTLISSFLGKWGWMIRIVKEFWKNYGDEIHKALPMFLGWADKVRYHTEVLIFRMRYEWQKFWVHHGADVAAGIETIKGWADKVRYHAQVMTFRAQYEWQKFWVRYGDNIEDGKNRWKEFAGIVVTKMHEMWAKVQGPLRELGSALMDLVRPLTELGGHLLNAFVDGLTVLALGAGPVVTAAVKGWIFIFTALVKLLTAAIDHLNKFFSMISGWRNKVGSLDFSSQGWGDFVDGMGIMLGRDAPEYRARGGIVGGVGNTDVVPAMLTPGEEVLRRDDPRHALNGGGGTVVNIYNPTVRNDRDIDALVEKIDRALFKRHQSARLGMPA